MLNPTDSATIGCIGRSIDRVLRQEIDLNKARWGYKLDRVGRVIALKIDLMGESLDVDTRAIGQLEALRDLRINNAQITAIADEIGNLLHLETLSLMGNALIQLPDTFARLNTLQFLDLSKNNFAEWPPVIDHLISLQFLRFSMNNLKHLPASISNLANLDTLDLSSNKLESIPSAICKLKLVSSLSLEGNYLTELPSSFGNLEHLKTLNLMGNKLSDLPVSFAELGALEILVLSGNAFQRPPWQVGYLQNLHHLVIGENPWDGATRAQIPALNPPESEPRMIDTASIMQALKETALRGFQRTPINESTKIEPKFLELCRQQALDYVKHLFPQLLSRLIQGKFQMDKEDLADPRLCEHATLLRKVCEGIATPAAESLRHYIEEHCGK